jgi:hypothetical protein
MWDRSILKSNARLAISGSKYWTAYAVCVVAALISSIFAIILGFVMYGQHRLMSAIVTTIVLINYAATVLASQTHFVRPKLVWLSLLEVLVTILVVFPLSVGLCRFFVHNRFGDTKFETLFSSFKSMVTATPWERCL